MFVPKEKIKLKDLEVPTAKNSGYFYALVPQADGTKQKHTEHSSALIGFGASYDDSSDTWQIWVAGYIRTYRRVY